MKATCCILNAELFKLFRNDKVFTTCLRILQEIMKKTEFVFIQRCLVPPMIQPIKFAFQNSGKG